MTVYLIPNLSRRRAVSTTCKVLETLSALGAKTVMTPELVDTFRDTAAMFCPEQEALAACDAVVTVGGDGTILHAARSTYGSGKPLLGVNIGHMGFLATVEPDELHKLRRLVRGEYQLDRRGGLLVTLPDGSQRIALNDMTVGKCSPSRTVQIDITSDGIPVNSYFGDGVVIATPTGSTAYSLSAGGPILDARIAGLVVTPICAHSLRSPAMVFSAQRKLRVTVCADEDVGACFSCDGSDEPVFSGEKSVEAAFIDKAITLVSFHEAEQFEAIDRKLKGR